MCTGKSSLAEFLNSYLNKKFCTSKCIYLGSLLSAQRKHRTPFGLTIDRALKNGQAVPLDIVYKTLLDSYKLLEERVVIIEGVPRNDEQLNYTPFRN